ncbi:hypothetical protein FRB97_001420 [Tulasnella sp. 331]|nr:hypothetical protein FRB97_001420 [Tulasnella sp. 331]KAG8890955.1 hypothetical protein FRB98_002975 [Tulasnella sp. 332]
MPRNPLAIRWLTAFLPLILAFIFVDAEPEAWEKTPFACGPSEDTLASGSKACAAHCHSCCQINPFPRLHRCLVMCTDGCKEAAEVDEEKPVDEHKEAPTEGQEEKSAERHDEL